MNEELDFKAAVDVVIDHIILCDQDSLDLPEYKTMLVALKLADNLQSGEFLNNQEWDKNGCPVLYGLKEIKDMIAQMFEELQNE